MFRASPRKTANLSGFGGKIQDMSKQAEEIVNAVWGVARCEIESEVSFWQEAVDIVDNVLTRQASEAENRNETRYELSGER